MGSPRRRQREDSGTPAPPGEDETPPVRVSRRSDRSRSRERSSRRGRSSRSPKRGSMDEWDKSTQQFLSKIGADRGGGRGGGGSSYSGYGSGSSAGYDRRGQGYGPPPVHSIPMVSLTIHNPHSVLTGKTLVQNCRRKGE